jgi:hypothetical protein
VLVSRGEKEHAATFDEATIALGEAGVNGYLLQAVRNAATIELILKLPGTPVVHLIFRHMTLRIMMLCRPTPGLKARLEA